MLFEANLESPIFRASVKIPVGNMLLGPVLELPAQHASINVSLSNKVYTFDYNNPSSICSIRNAARNEGLVWGIFAAVLVLTLANIKVWHKCKQGSGSTSPAVLSR